MASSSSSSSSPSSSNMILISPTKYDVFLSFKGEDTRDNFTSHLYDALCRKQIPTFIDNQLIRGDEISLSLLNAIECSKISVVIFSQRYASSKWCLEELVKILECKTNYGQIVIPVFYLVDPSDVRNQIGTFGDEFSKLEERFQGRLDKLQTWRIALREAANLSGFDSLVIRPESHLIEKIIGDILDRLCDTFQSDNKDLFGVESRIKEIESLLSIKCRDVRILGIWGFGGIGKTTIASVIFNKISKYFEGSHFVQNVREAEKNGELRQLQRELFFAILEDENVKFDIPKLSFQSKRLNHKKVLIVFDDVTHLKQLEFLIGHLGRFALGSRIIITTRDKQVLQNCRVSEIYKMEELAYNDALKLFSQYAFGQHLLDESYIELSKKVIEYAHGVPLALKILGCFLSGKSEEVWKSTISKLKKIPNTKIQEALKISYDGLDDNEKNIFLDIVFFFVGKDRNFATNFFDACGFFPEIEMSVLIDKCLITISENKIFVHDLLQDMGREIVRQESINDPGKRNRLCNYKDICEVLEENTGTEAIEGISLNMDLIKEIHLNPYTFKRMPNLRFLNFYHTFFGKNKCKISYIHGRVFTKLRYFQWDGYPLKSLPLSFKPENLVSLIMPNSNIKQLWDGVQNFFNLKHIDLSDSKQLMKLPDLSMAINLETLNLSWCTSLIEIPCESSILHLTKLVFLSLQYCVSLKSLPTSIHLESLEEIIILGCSNLKSFPEISPCYIEELDLSETAIKELPSSIECLSKLYTLELCNCKILKSLPSSLCKLKSLGTLKLSGCSNLQRLPDELGNLESLQELYANETAIKELPSSIGCLSRLHTLKLYDCKILESLPSSLCKLKSLIDLDISCCSNLQRFPDELGNLESLRELNAEGTSIREIPLSIIHLSNLWHLNISDCKRLQCLPELPCRISEMNACGCTSLEALSSLSFLFTPPWSYQNINLSNCLKLEPVEVSQMVKDAHPKLPFMANKWREGYYGSSYGRNNVRICIPGSEIPDWFSYQGRGSSITVQLQSDWGNDKFVGFELCAIASFEEHHDNNWDLKVRCERKRKTKGSHGQDADSQHFQVGTNFGDVRTNHIYFGFIFKKYLDCKSCYENEVFFQFYLKSRDGSQIEYDAVKECGIHLLYDEDEVEEEKEPHPQKIEGLHLN